MSQETLNSPSAGRELEFIIDLVKQLNNIELAIEQSREKLVLRCKEFNNKVALKLFNPPKEESENMYQANVKKAFKQVGIVLEPYQAKDILSRFDSNYDGEITYSDVCDIFKPLSKPLQKELVKRTIHLDQHVSVGSNNDVKISKHCKDYIKDLFAVLLQAASVADKIRLAILKRPMHSV